jgi:hypothetical protein
MRRLLVLLLLTTALHAETYRDEKCGIEFDLPAGWSAGRTDRWLSLEHDLKRSQIRCEFGIRPRGWKKRAAEADGFLAPYAIDIIVADAPFLAVARLAFSRQDGQWFIDSRGTSPPAIDFRTACCQAVQGSGWSRAWNKANEVGTATYDIVVLNDRKRHSVYIETEIAEEFETELKRIVNTWRFIR